jgi:hypothetical protein
MTTVTIAPFADLAMVGMSFLAEEHCPAAMLAKERVRTLAKQSVVATVVRLFSIEKQIQRVISNLRMGAPFRQVLPVAYTTIISGYHPLVKK